MTERSGRPAAERETRLREVFRRGPRRLVMLTAYDAITARLAREGGADALLVGDSLGTTVQGRASTRGVLLDHMVYHTEIVARTVEDLPVVADLPAGTYQDPTQALESARRLITAGAWAVKFEGNPPGVARALTAAGIPAMGHLGLLPQTAEEYRVRGKDPHEAERIRADARALEGDGVFALVLECVPRRLAREVQQAAAVPVIGIGAGEDVQGQVLVIYDLLQMPPGGRWPRFVPTRYPAGGAALLQVIRGWVDEVREGLYPQDGETYE